MTTNLLRPLSKQSTSPRSPRLAVLAATLLLFGGYRTANAFSITITVDENGNGRFTNTAGFNSGLPFGPLRDPGPGGLPNVLTYSLINPPGLTAGDVLLQEAPGGPISDVIRFNPAENCFGSIGCLLFYSDNADGVDALGDTGLPGALYTNVITLQETGVEGGFQNAIYVPVAGQPGFVTGAAGPVTYNLISDVPKVPEPATLSLLGAGFAGLAAFRRYKRS